MAAPVPHMKGTASNNLPLAVLLIAFPVVAQQVTYTSESFETHRGAEITLIGDAYAMPSNALIRTLSGCEILLNTENGSFAVSLGSPRTSWAQIYIPCDVYRQPDGEVRRVSVTGILKTGYPGKYVRGVNVKPIYVELESIAVLAH